jgi:hypothetical protein
VLDRLVSPPSFSLLKIVFVIIIEVIHGIAPFNFPIVDYYILTLDDDSDIFKTPKKYLNICFLFRIFLMKRSLNTGDIVTFDSKVLTPFVQSLDFSSSAAFSQPENENETFLVLSFPISSFDERIGFSVDGNLFRTFGTANISGTVEAVVNKLAGSEGDVYQVDVVSVDANVTDLYGWDYDKGGDYDEPFALMQGGFDTIARGGKIFKLRTRLDGYISDFQHFINPIEG